MTGGARLHQGPAPPSCRSRHSFGRVPRSRTGCRAGSMGLSRTSRVMACGCAAAHAAATPRRNSRNRSPRRVMRRSPSAPPRDRRRHHRTSRPCDPSARASGHDAADRKKTSVCRSPSAESPGSSQVPSGTSTVSGPRPTMWYQSVAARAVDRSLCGRVAAPQVRRSTGDGVGYRRRYSRRRWPCGVRAQAREPATARRAGTMRAFLRHPPSASAVSLRVPPCPRSATTVCRSTDRLAPLARFCSSGRQVRSRLRCGGSAHTALRDTGRARRRHGDAAHQVRQGRAGGRASVRPSGACSRRPDTPGSR